jgi:hypothetical protein
MGAGGAVDAAGEIFWLFGCPVAAGPMAVCQYCLDLAALRAFDRFMMCTPMTSPATCGGFVLGSAAVGTKRKPGRVLGAGRGTDGGSV